MDCRQWQDVVLVEYNVVIINILLKLGIPVRGESYFYKIFTGSNLLSTGCVVAFGEIAWCRRLAICNGKIENGKNILSFLNRF